MQNINIPFFDYNVINLEAIGDYIAEGLKNLVAEMPIENINLLGFSIGGQLVGIIGRKLYEKTGQLFPRITALDPVLSCFGTDKGLQSLQSGDAEFLEIIHSNPGGFGIADALGDADYYVNGMKPLPPGCLDIFCAHFTSVKVYVESAYPGNEENFLAVQCDSLESLQRGNCENNSKFPMGYDSSTEARGSLFLEINRVPPYGQNADKHETNQECVKC